METEDDSVLLKDIFDPLEEHVPKLIIIIPFIYRLDKKVNGDKQK